MREHKLILTGLTLLCIVSTAALLRLIAVLKIYRRRRHYSALLNEGNGSQIDINGDSSAAAASSSHSIAADGVAPSRILLPSLVFHVLLFLCLAAEVPVYACRYAATLQSGGGFTTVGRPLYAVHLSSYLLLFSAFCVIVTLWSEVAVFEPNDWTMLMNRSMLVLCLFYLVVTVVAVSVCLGVGSVKYFFSSVAFMLFCTYSIVALLLLGSCFLVLGCLLQRRICRVLVTGSCTARLTARVVRLNVVVLACFICFTMRAYMLAALVEVQAEGEVDRHFSRGWKKWEWDMRLEWAPHIIPCVAMLYLMRNAGEPTSGDSYAGDSDERGTAFAEGDVENGGRDKKEGGSNYGSYAGSSGAR